MGSWIACARLTRPGSLRLLRSHVAALALALTALTFRVGHAQPAPSSPDPAPAPEPPLPQLAPTDVAQPPASVAPSVEPTRSGIPLPATYSPTGGKVEAQASPAETGTASGAEAPAKPVAPSGDEVSFAPIGADLVSEAELAEFLAQSEEALSDTPQLRFYGFSDFSMSVMKGFGADGDETDIFAKPSFYVGNLNLYADADLTGGWRSLFEVRFLYLPQGSRDATTLERYSATAADYAELSRTLSWGGIEIERAWLQYEMSSLLTIRAGQWLTPYGIWNVDHGTPTVIPAFRPYVIGERLFPERQMGLQLLGSQLLGELTLGYHLTLSNGRGPIPYEDLDNNKAVGGRVYLTSHALGTFTVGLSGYYGRYTDAQDKFVFTADGVTFGEDINSQFDEFGWAMDVAWRWNGFHFQGEVVVQDVAYTDAGRPGTNVAYGGAPDKLMPDYRYVGAYALLGYRFSWLGIMPFIMVAPLDTGRDYVPVESVGVMTGRALELYAGLNVRPTPAVVLKAQVAYVRVSGPLAEFAQELNVAAFQMAWSF